MTLQSAISLSLSFYFYEPGLHQAYERRVIAELQLMKSHNRLGSSSIPSFHKVGGQEQQHALQERCVLGGRGPDEGLKPAPVQEAVSRHEGRDDFHGAVGTGRLAAENAEAAQRTDVSGSRDVCSISALK